MSSGRLQKEKVCDPSGETSTLEFYLYLKGSSSFNIGFFLSVEITTDKSCYLEKPETVVQQNS